MNPRLSAAWSWSRERCRQHRVWLLLLVAIALCYYGSYCHHSLNFRDEGGAEALIAQRLLAGERPFTDVVLGYNVLWFYPIVGLFKIWGVNFLLLRAYCFALSTLAAVLGFLAVQRAGGRAWLAFLVGLLLVLVPGMTFKNYMPLLAVANACTLLHFSLSPRRATAWLSLGGVVLGLTLLIRIDVGLFCALLWLGALWLRSLQERRPLVGVAWTALLVALVVTVHLPIYLDARQRGFESSFLGQYVSWPKSLIVKLSPHAPEKAVPAKLPLPVAAAAVPGSRDTLHRLGWRDFVSGDTPEEQLLAVLIYWPIVTLGILTVWAVWRMVRGWRRGLEIEFRTGLAALLIVGAAFTTFPQYFFFRPDSPHLSEFSPGFWVAAAGGWLLLRQPRQWAAWLFAVIIVAHAGIYLWRMMPDRWTGTIAARKARTYRFRAENGVDVMVTRRELEAFQELSRLITENSRPEDYLVAYPYHPTFNVMANRRTYEKNVYIDNATSRPGWDAEAIARLQKFSPAIVILSDWDVNGTPASRFSIWAAKTKTWIETHYTDQGTYLDFQLFTRNAETH